MVVVKLMHVKTKSHRSEACRQSAGRAHPDHRRHELRAAQVILLLAEAHKTLEQTAGLLGGGPCQQRSTPATLQKPGLQGCSVLAKSLGR